jgi:hypothetical protein
MPEFFGHMRTMRRMIRRWGIASLFGSGANFREMTSWLQPTVRVDREWDDDDRLMWGYTADSGAIGAGYPAVAIFSQSKEVLIRRLDAAVYAAATGYTPTFAEVNILTPPAGYNPVEYNAGEFFPFLQTTKATGLGGAPLSIPEARVIGGRATTLLSVSIGGVLVNPAIGPRRRLEWMPDLLLGVTAKIPAHVTLLDWIDPPIILPPYRVLAVQWHNRPVSGDFYLQVEVYLSERVTA